MVHVDFLFFKGNCALYSEKKILQELKDVLKRHPKFRNLVLICYLFMQRYASVLTSGFIQIMSAHI